MSKKIYNLLSIVLFLLVSIFYILFSYSCVGFTPGELPYGERQIPCEIQEALLNNGEGIIFSIGKKVQKDGSDIYFENNKFYCRKGEIATVGDQGYKSLCDINYPEKGYSGSCEIKEMHVYIFNHTDIRAEIRIILFRESEEVKFRYHVRMD